MLNLFQHLIPLFFVSCLAYAELNVNFVEGFAVQCLRRLWLRCFSLRRFCIKGLNDSMLSCDVDFISTECF